MNSTHSANSQMDGTLYQRLVQGQQELVQRFEAGAAIELLVQASSQLKS